MDIIITGITGITAIIAGVGTIVSPDGIAGITILVGAIALTDMLLTIVQETIVKHIQGRKPCRKDQQTLKINIPLWLREIPDFRRLRCLSLNPM
jgi:hypothetical protein